MENYTKGKNVELEVCVEDCLPGCVEEVEKFTVLPSTRLRDVIDSCLQILKCVDQVIWVGCGPAAGKAVSGAEVIKRRVRGLHQLTRLTCKRVEEYWEPKLDGLDTLKVLREIPVVVILLSRLPLDPSLPGYQVSGMLGEDFCKSEEKPRRRRKERTGKDYTEENVKSSASNKTKRRNCEAKKSEECFEEEGGEERAGTRGGGEGRNARLRRQNGRGNRGRGRGERMGDKNYNWRNNEENDEWERWDNGNRGRGENYEENGHRRYTEELNEEGQGRGRGRGDDNRDGRRNRGMNKEWYGRRGRGSRRLRRGNETENWRNIEGRNNEYERGKIEKREWDKEERNTVGEFGRGRRGRGRGSRRIGEGIYEGRKEDIED